VCAMLDSQELIIDVSNVAWDGVIESQGQKPRYSNIALCLEYFRNKQHKKPIADATLRHEIDDKASYQKALDNDDMIQSSAGRKAEDLILGLAKEFSDAKIVTNDAFSDYLAQAGYDRDLALINPLLKRERFIRFKIINEYFIELPFKIDFPEKLDMSR
jgi:hypothetical protein